MQTVGCILARAGSGLEQPEISIEHHYPQQPALPADLFVLAADEPITERPIEIVFDHPNHSVRVVLTTL